MIKNKFLALAMAAAMTLATAVPAFAEQSGTTTVSLTIEAPSNTYTLTVPANTELNSDGTAKQLTGGIKITEGALQDGKKITVTAESENKWEMVAADAAVKTKIGYGLYANSTDNTTTTSWDFSQTDANAESGTTKNVYAKANTTDVNAAKAGEYSDVITFTAALDNAGTAVESVSLNRTELNLNTGAEETLSATVTPANATDKTVTWTSSAPSVATVDQNGKVTAVAGGSANITAAAGGKSATCTVTVAAARIMFSIGNNGYSVDAGTTWTEFASGAGSGYVEILGEYSVYCTQENGYVMPAEGQTVRASVAIESGRYYVQQ